MKCNRFCPQDQSQHPSDQLFCSWALPEISCASWCLVPCSFPLPIPSASLLSPILEPLSPCTQTCPVIVITSSMGLWWLSWTAQLDLADLVWRQKRCSQQSPVQQRPALVRSDLLVLGVVSPVLFSMSRCTGWNRCHALSPAPPCESAIGGK